ncbi:MAG: ComEC/Rec2 family competence protein [bacterium]|nr:ComEC/Rec2 family competence protein [bacterium]
MDQKTNTNSIFVFIFGFISGILASSFVFIVPLISVFVVIIGSTLLVAEKIWNKKIIKEVLFLSLALLSFGLGVLRYSIKDFHEPLIPISTGIVVSEPEQRENTTRFILLADNGEKVLVNTDLYSPIQYGDRIEVNGKLQEPGIIDDENGGRPFDYGKYLSKDDIYYTLNFTKVEVLSSGHGNLIKRALFKIKRSFVGKTKEILSEPYASLLSGLIVSGREAMPKDILEEFRRAGVIHIVVLSGYNITIIAEFMRKMLENFFLLAHMWVSPRLVAGASILGIILFVLMTGAEATVVRAALMVLVVIAAKMLGRRYSAPRALLVAAFLMILHNPKILVFDPSFQLSFLATCALIYLVPILEKYLVLIPEKWGLRIIIATTVATQVTVLPLLIYSVGDFSLASLPANILVLLIIPATMFLGFIATLIAYASSILALPFSYATYILLAWILGVSGVSGNLSFTSVAVPSVPIWLIVLIYLAIFIFVRCSGSNKVAYDTVNKA